MSWADTRSAVDQAWPAFALVAGLLLVGAVADDDGVFRAAGVRLHKLARHPVAAFVGAATLVSVVTAVLNLDTAASFLPPVFVAAAGVGTATAGATDDAAHGDTDSGSDGPVMPLLYGCLLLCNAASLLLPGSNLTNLIVLGPLHRSGAELASHMVLPWVASILVTSAVVAWVHRRQLKALPDVPRTSQPVGLLGTAAVVAVTVVTVTVGSPAPWVLLVGVVAAVVSAMRRGWPGVRHAVDALGAPVLAALFAVAVLAGTLGRAWSGPARLLAHGGVWGSAALGAVLSPIVNNLPAAALLAARHPAHPYALLTGLDIGPNLAVTGSLSALLWWRSATRAGARLSVAHVSRLGLVAVPLSMAASVSLLSMTGAH